MRKKLKKRNSVSWVTYTVVLLIGLAMLYPIIWMFFATFKSNAEIFGSVKLLPSSFSFQSYIDGWHVNSKITYTTFFKNSFVMTIITTLFTILSLSLIHISYPRWRSKCRTALSDDGRCLQTYGKSRPGGSDGSREYSYSVEGTACHT